MYYQLNDWLRGQVSRAKKSYMDRFPGSDASDEFLGIHADSTSTSTSGSGNRADQTNASGRASRSAEGALGGAATDDATPPVIPNTQNGPDAQGNSDATPATQNAQAIWDRVLLFTTNLNRGLHRRKPKEGDASV